MNQSRPIRIGTRGSKLALWQSEHVADILRETTGREVELQIIKTTGDIILDVPLAKIGDKGLFVKEIENALLAGEVDIAVHSMKDMPTTLPEGLIIDAALIRQDPQDAIITRDKGSQGNIGEPTGREVLLGLAPGARVGTSSLRRRAQIMNVRTDLEIVDLRGNLDTRLRKLDEGEYDAIILAGAGVRRLGWGERITGIIPAETVLPAVGQGAIAIETTAANPDGRELCRLLNHTDTLLAVRAERALMRDLEGGCQVPIGALATIQGDIIDMRGVIASLDGTRLLKVHEQGAIHDPEELGLRVAAGLRAQGADDILAQIRAAAEEPAD